MILQRAVIRGAVHRLRPKLLTEVAMIFRSCTFGSGARGRVRISFRPMAAPGWVAYLIADEVVDLLVPALFFAFDAPALGFDQSIMVRMMNHVWFPQNVCLSHKCLGDGLALRLCGKSIDAYNPKTTLRVRL